MRTLDLAGVFEKTGGHCHFCGDRLVFDRRGWAPNMRGRWEVDHVVQRAKGGARSRHNCLPTCTRCNRLRWHRTGKVLREALFLGLIAREEIRKGTPLGRELRRLRNRRIDENKRRRAPRR